jgi:hypothetical protein
VVEIQVVEILVVEIHMCSAPRGAVREDHHARGAG